MTVEEAIEILEYSNEMLKEQIAALKSGETLLDEVDKSAYQTIEYCQSEYVATELAIKALREKREREENKPLTLEQLREMVDSDECGVHIWVLKTVSRSVVSALTDVTCPDGVVAIWNANATENFKEKDYGQTWFAYRHKPEGSEGE